MCILKTTFKKLTEKTKYQTQEKGQHVIKLISIVPKKLKTFMKKKQNKKKQKKPQS